MPRFPTRPALALLGALTLLCFAACAPTATVSVSPTATTPPTPTAPAGFPALAAEGGWRVVLTLGNVFGNSAHAGGRFVATKPYRLRLACTGPGQLQVDYTAGGLTVPCGVTPAQLGHTGEFLPPPGDGQVTVNVSTEGTCLWEIVAEMQD